MKKRAILYIDYGWDYMRDVYRIGVKRRYYARNRTLGLNAEFTREFIENMEPDEYKKYPARLISVLNFKLGRTATKIHKLGFFYKKRRHK